MKKQENVTITRKKISKQKQAQNDTEDGIRTDFRATIIDMFKNSQENISTTRTIKGETVRSEMKI